jgi:methyl-accepting chemotaxis protein
MTTVPESRGEALFLSSLEQLIAGKYLSVPEGDCPLSRKIHELARSLHAKAQDEAKMIVQSSVICSEAVTATAEMMRDAVQVDKRSQTIAAAAEELVASVEEISRSAEAASEDARSAQDLAEMGQRDADQAVSSMENIARAVEGAATKVTGLAEASAKIGEIVLQIEGIASQTNLLALNATIEAARAGEAGKGFAVVASEVKNLANQTAKATVDIRTRIDNLRTEMAAIVGSMQESAEAVQKGQAVIMETGRGMRNINNRIGDVSGRINEISSILSQQATASQEVARAVTVIAEMAGHNVNGIGEILSIMDRMDPIIAAAVADLVKREIADLTLHLAKSDHMIWRKKLAQMVVGKIALNPAELADHRNCRLGKWYVAVSDDNLRRHPSFGRLEGPHREVHAHGIEAAKRFQSGDLEGALDEIRKTAEASQGVMQRLDELANRRS